MKDDSPSSGSGSEHSDVLFERIRVSGVGPQLADELQAAVDRRRRRRILGAGVLGVVLVAAAFVWRGVATSESADATGVSTGQDPERRSLPDGSRADVNVGSSIAVEFSSTVRRVILERGEVRFHVARDPRRPFVVVVSGWEFRAVGTVFFLSRDRRVVELFVEEGRVAVKREVARSSGGALNNEADIIVTAGNQASFDIEK